MFKNLKNKSGFSPKLFNIDFNNALFKAIKQNFPDVYIIKCFFHYVQSLFKKIKKLGLNKKNFNKELFELLYNIKMLSFIKPDIISNVSKKLKKKYNDKTFLDFYSYYERKWLKLKNKKINS